MEIIQKDAVIAEQNQTIMDLRHQIANLEARLAVSSTPKSSRRQQSRPRNLELQNDCRALIATQATSGYKYDYNLPFDNEINREITRKVCDEYQKNCVKENVSPFSLAEMEQCCRSYFRNAKQDESREDRGVKEEHRTNVRNRKRKRTKLEERRAALKADRSYTPEELELLELGKFLVETIQLDGVSSEESEDDSLYETPTHDRRKRKRQRKNQVCLSHNGKLNFFCCACQMMNNEHRKSGNSPSTEVKNDLQTAIMFKPVYTALLLQYKN